VNVLFLNKIKEDKFYFIKIISGGTFI